MPEGTIAFDVTAPIEKVWSFLSDIRQVGRCVPGVDRIEVLDATHARWDLTVKIGPLSQTLKVTTETLEQVPPPWTVPRVGGQHRHDRDDRTRVDWSRDSGGLHDEREHERTAREDHGQLPEDEVEVADGRVRGERETSARRVTVDSAGTGRGATSRSIMITGAAPF